MGDDDRHGKHTCLCRLRGKQTECDRTKKLFEESETPALSKLAKMICVPASLDEDHKDNYSIFSSNEYTRKRSWY